MDKSGVPAELMDRERLRLGRHRPDRRVTLPAGHMVQVAAVIAGDLTCPSEDPDKGSCRRLESPPLIGDSTGVTADYIVA